MPKLAEAASNDELITVLKNHLGDTQEHVKRVEQAFADLKEDAKSATCVGMKGVISEGEDHMDEDYGEPGLRDAAIIGFSQRVEHYEIAAYGTAIAHARLLGCTQVVRLLQATLAEENGADRTLTDMAERVVNRQAAQGRRLETEIRSRTTM